MHYSLNSAFFCFTATYKHIKEFNKLFLNFFIDIRISAIIICIFVFLTK